MSRTYTPLYISFTIHMQYDQKHPLWVNYKNITKRQLLLEQCHIYILWSEFFRWTTLIKTTYRLKLPMKPQNPLFQINSKSLHWIYRPSHRYTLRRLFLFRTNPHYAGYEISAVGSHDTVQQ